MRCEKAFDVYLGLDKNQRVPLSVTLHLLACPECRTSVRKLTRAERLLAQPLTVPESGESAASASVDPSLVAMLSRISAAGLEYPPLCPAEHSVSLYRWLVSGIALIAGFAIIPFSAIGAWTGVTFGNSFLVPFYILCGVAITGYCGLFVGTNIDFFVKKFGFHHSI